MDKKLLKIIKESERYKDFTVLDKPKSFKDLFAGKDITLVQVHSSEVMGDDIIGFCGVFEWKKDRLISLDGDSYNPEMTVLAYSYFTPVFEADEMYRLMIKCLEDNGFSKDENSEFYYKIC